MIHRRKLLLSLLSLGPATAAWAASWPRFRGAGALGIAPPGSSPPDTWSATENIVWKRLIPGLGWSSPVVWENNIFLNSTLRNAEQDEPPKGFYEGGQVNSISADEHRWMTYCIDFENGKIRWAAELHRGVPKAPRHRKNTYASETPVTDGERVYAHFGGVGIYCLDSDGKLLWSKPWPALETRYGYGTGASPALHEGRLYIVNDNEEQSYIVALDKLTGNEIWRTGRDEPTTWSTPFVWKNAQRTEIITAGRKKIRSYDLDGKPLWELSGMSGLTIPSPFAAGGLLYVSSGFRVSAERPAYAIRTGAGGDITLQPGKTSNEFVAWSLPHGGPYHPSPVLYRGKYYTLFDGGFLTCHDAKTGQEIYGKQRIAVGSGNFTSSPWASGGKLFCLSENGDTYVIQAGASFKVLGKNPLGEMAMATPAIAGDSLILRTYSSLYRIADRG
jgi:outer membrane protein assembly factor BamB